MTYLLDTHVWLRLASAPKLLSRAQRRVVEKATAENPLLLSAISLWEVANLTSLGRVRLNAPLREWLEQATAQPTLRVCDLTVAVVSEIATFGERIHRDPADRIIIATARVHGAKLLTSDVPIAESGLVEVVD